MGSVGWRSTLVAIWSSESSTTSTTAHSVSGRPRNVMSRSIGESGMWNWTLRVKFPMSESELLVSGAPRGDAGILAPWLLAAPNDTARRAAVTTGALKNCMSMNVSANGIRIVALALQLGLIARN